jgi:hypothetical protein
MNEIGRAKKWIKSKLAADGETAGIVETRIYTNESPKATKYPYIFFNLQGGFDTRGAGTVRIQSNPVFQIKVITDGHPDDNDRTVADRIDELFQNAVTEISDGFVFSSRREQPIDYPDPKPDSSGFFTHLGGLYRLLIYPEASGA